MRRCTRCSEEKPIVAFSLSRAAKDGYHAWCKACKSASTRAWFAANRERELAKDRAEYASDGADERARARQWHADNRERSLASKRAWKLSIYGLTPQDYDARLGAQGNRCAICAREANGNKAQRDFAVDHCHDTRVVRGLLCHHCNVGLGHFFDSPDALRAAADYLERSTARKSA